MKYKFYNITIAFHINRYIWNIINISIDILLYSTYLINYDSTYRLKATEDSGDEETQSKNNQKVERGLLVSIK